MPRSRALAAGLVAGVVADRVLGDPRRWHPVAGFGQLAAALERAMWRPSRTAGVAYTIALAGGATAAAGWAQRRARGRPAAELLLTGAATWVALGAGRWPWPGGSWPRRSGRGTWRRPAGSPRCWWGGTRATWTGRSCAGRRWSRWPRTPPTRSWARWSGGCWPGRPGWSATGRPTPLTPWSATGAPATGGSAGPRPAWTTWPGGRGRGSGPAWPAWPRRRWAAAPAGRGGRCGPTGARTRAPTRGRWRRP